MPKCSVLLITESYDRSPVVLIELVIISSLAYNYNSGVPTCSQVEEEVCEVVNKEVCQQVEEQSCKRVSDFVTENVCSDVQVNQCVPVTEEVCQPSQETRYLLLSI